MKFVQLNAFFYLVFSFNLVAELSVDKSESSLGIIRKGDIIEVLTCVREVNQL